MSPTMQGTLRARCAAKVYNGEFTSLTAAMNEVFFAGMYGMVWHWHPLRCLLLCPLLLPLSNSNAVATPSLRISFVVVCLLLRVRIRLPAHSPVVFSRVVLCCSVGWERDCSAVVYRPIQPNAEGTRLSHSASASSATPRRPGAALPRSVVSSCFV